MGKGESIIPCSRRDAWRGGLAGIALAIAIAGAIDPAISVAKEKKPDLRVTAVSTSATSLAGSGLETADTTKNLGPRAAPRSTTGFVLSTDERRDKADLVLRGQRAVPKLSSVTVHVDPHSADGHDHHAELAHHDRH